MRTADQHVEVLVPAPDGGSVEQQSTFEVNQRTGHIAPVWDAAISASLGLSQPQASLLLFVRWCPRWCLAMANGANA